MRKRVTEDKKKELVNLYEKGLLIKEICEIHNVSKSALYNWISEFSLIKKSHETKKEITVQDYCLMERRIDYLERQSEILKNRRCTVSSPTSDKVNEIARLKKEYDYSIRAMSEIFSINRSTINYHLNKPDTISMSEDNVYSEMIKQIFDESNGVFGAKKIRVILKNKGYQIGERRLQRLMDEQNLKCNRKATQRKYLPEEHRQYYKNKPNRKFKQIMPNKAWLSDITYFKVNNTKCYICVVIDLFSRKIISHEVSTKMVELIVSTAFLDAYLERGKLNNLIFHSDQGAQYKSNSFMNKLIKNNVSQSFSKAGCPYDNAVAESFFASLKKRLHNGEYESITDLRKDVDDYIIFFNEKRPHQSLDYLTSMQIEVKYHENIKKPI